MKRPPSLQLPGRGASVTAVARRGGHQEGDHYSKPTPVEKRSNRCGCGRSPRPEYGDDGKALPIAVGGSRVQSWVVGQQKYYRVKRHPGATSPTHPTGNDGQDISQGVSRYPIQTGEYELLSPRSLFFEASPSLAEPSPAYTGSYDNIILSLSPKPALYPCPCYEEAPEYQEVDPNPASFYNATSRSAERRKSYVGYHDKR